MASIAASLAGGDDRGPRRKKGTRVIAGSVEIPANEMFSAILTIERADGVKACDRSGTSDPYCLLFLLPSGDPSLCTMSSSTDGSPDSSSKSKKGKLLGRTPIHFKTLDPVWNFPVYLPAIECPTMQTPLLRLEVWDDDSVRDDFIGMLEISAVDFGNVFATVNRQTRPLVARPPTKKLLRASKIDEGITGTISFSIRLGCVDRAIKQKLRSAMRATLATTLSSGSFTLFAVPPSLEPLPPSFFQQSAASSSSIAAPQDAKLFSMRLTFHCASNLKELRKPNPYVLCYLVSRALGESETKRELVFRSPVIYNTLNPVWTSNIITGCVRSTDVFEWEVRNWKRGARDSFFGMGSLSFPQSGYPLPPQPPIEVPLRPKHHETDIRGSVTVSYETAEAVLDRHVTVHDLFEKFDASEYLATPSLENHCRNYGVSIPNFRDIGGWPVSFVDPVTGAQRTGRMKTRTVFRTSGISRATELDAQLIVAELNIKTCIDLRTADYAGNRGPYLTSYFDVMQPDGNGKLTYSKSNQHINLSLRDVENTMIASSAQKDSWSSEEQTVAKAMQAVPFDYRAEDAASTSRRIAWGHLYLCSLVGKRFELAMIRKSKKSALLTAGLLAANPQEQRRIICGPIFDDPLGLTILYQMLLENSKSEFHQLFELLLNEATLPLAYFCNHGKDRTGMVTAFLQSICGVNRETIIDNYMLSDYLLRPLKTVVDYEMMDGGLTPEIMSRTPAETMRNTFKYIDEVYKSVPDYLAHIGFSKEKQAALREKLVDVDPLG